MAAADADRSTLIPILIGAAVVGFVLVGLKYLPGRRGNEVPPDTRLLTLELTPLTDDAPAVSPSSLSGKVVVVNFWATWCPPCVQELPHLAALAKQYQGRDDFSVVAISCDDDGDVEAQRATVVEFLSGRGLAIPAYADPNGQTRRSLPGGIWSDAIPLTLLVDRDGRLVGIWRGYREAEFNELKLKVAKLLERATE